MRLLVALWVAFAVAAGSVAGVQAAGAATPKKAPAKAKVTCRWVKATKKRKRHKVCVKVKAKPKATKKTATPAPAAPTAPPPAQAPAPAVAGAPAVTAPPITDVVPVPGPAPTVPAIARLQVTAREFSLTLSRPAIVAGPLTLELVNRGEDPHDLHVRPAAGGADVLAIDRTDGAGTLGSADGTLAAGTYTLYCSLVGHEAAGMKATLTVQ